MSPAPEPSFARDAAGGARIDVRVTPRAPRTAVEGVRDGRLLLRVTAPPVDAAANDAVVALLARALDVPKRDITIVLGLQARLKTIQIAGLSAATVQQRLIEVRIVR